MVFYGRQARAKRHNKRYDVGGDWGNRNALKLFKKRLKGSTASHVISLQ